MFQCFVLPFPVMLKLCDLTLRHQGSIMIMIIGLNPGKMIQILDKELKFVTKALHFGLWDPDSSLWGSDIGLWDPDSSLWDRDSGLWDPDTGIFDSNSGLKDPDFNPGDSAPNVHGTEPGLYHPDTCLWEPYPGQRDGWTEGWTSSPLGYFPATLLNFINKPLKQVMGTTDHILPLGSYHSHRHFKGPNKTMLCSEASLLPI